MPFSLYMLALAVFVMGTSEFMISGLLPRIAADLDVSVATAGLLTSAFAIGMVVGAPTMAAFARRWSPRQVLLVCLVAFAGAHMIGAMTPTFWILLLARVISALANAGFLSVAMSKATTLVPSDRVGRAVSVLLAGTTLATVAGVPAGALVGELAGWRATFLGVALMCVPALMGILGGVPRGSQEDVAEQRPLRAELAVLTSTRLILVMVLGALVNGATFAVLTYLAPVVTDVAGLGQMWVPLTLVFFGMGSYLGVTVAGRFSDAKPMRLLVVGAPVLVLGWFLLAMCAQSPVMLLVLVPLMGMLSFGVGSTLISRVLYEASGAATMGGSYATAALNVGAVVGPVLGGLGLGMGVGGLVAPVWTAVGLTGLAVAIGAAWFRILRPEA